MTQVGSCSVLRTSPVRFFGAGMKEYFIVGPDGSFEEVTRDQWEELFGDIAMSRVPTIGNMFTFLFRLAAVLMILVGAYFVTMAIVVYMTEFRPAKVSQLHSDGSLEVNGVTQKVGPDGKLHRWDRSKQQFVEESGR